MTTAKPDDRSTLVDPRVADTWREASREEPPASLDAAILAAARREVSARPEALAAWEAREVRASRRRWWPLAAAATVAAIAVGVLQLTPTEKLGAPATESAIVSDVPVPAANEERKLASGDDGGIRSDAPPKDSPRQAAPRVVAPAPPSAAQSFAQPAAPPSAPTPSPAPAEPVVVAPPAVAPAPARASDPFPASPKVADQPAPSAGGEVAASRAERAAPATAAAPAPAATPPPAPAPLAKMATGRAADSASDDARARERAPLPVADWIALIRRLRTEGKQAEAAKELAAFRTAHPDHEKLLPPDLRDWRPG